MRLQVTRSIHTEVMVPDDLSLEDFIYTSGNGKDATIAGVPRKKKGVLIGNIIILSVPIALYLSLTGYGMVLRIFLRLTLLCE